MAKKDYDKGKRWGFSIFKKNYETFGEIGIKMSDKASLTCDKIIRSQKRNGKKLEKKDIDFYKGATKGFLDFYNKEIMGFKEKNKQSVRKYSEKNPFNDFEYTSTGRIKGSYIDGRFDPIDN